MDLTSSYDEDSEKPKIDWMDFERRQRQLLTELAMKRTQVEELKRELEASNLKIHEVTRSLDMTKTTLTEQECNLSLALKNAQFFEHQLQSKRDSVTKMCLQQESAVAEAKVTRELLQKAELQNYNLTQELNELKAQHKCDVAYQKDLMDQDKKIRAKIVQVTEAIKECQLSLSENQDMLEKIKLCEDAQKSVNFYQQQFYKYKDKYTKLQEKYIFVNAAMETFQQLTNDNQELFQTNNQMDAILNQWNQITECFKNRIATQDEIIEKLTKTLQSEKEVNAVICKNEAELDKVNFELKKENEELKKKLNYNKQCRNIETQTENLVKTEVIELMGEK